MSFASHKLADGIEASHSRLDPLDPTPPGIEFNIYTVYWTDR